MAKDTESATSEPSAPDRHTSGEHADKREVPRRPREIWAGSLTAAVLILGHYAEDNLVLPMASPEEDRTEGWTMEGLRSECELVEAGRRTREAYDEGLLSILDRFPLHDASFGPVVRTIPDKQLFAAARNVDLEPGGLSDLGPERRTRVSTILARQLAGVPRPGLEDPFPALLRRLLEARGARDVWMLGAEDHLAFEELRTIGQRFGAVYADERTGACTQATLQVLDPTARVERVAYLDDFPIDDTLDPLGKGIHGKDGRQLGTLVSIPDTLPAVIDHWIRESNGSGDAGETKSWEWIGRLEESRPALTDDDSLTIALARKILPDEGGFAALLVDSPLLAGGMGLELRSSLVEENLVRAVAHFEIPNETPHPTTYDLWILDTDRADDDPVYLMGLSGPGQRESFPHLYDDPFDEELAAGDLDRIVDALLHGRSIPYAGAAVDRKRILENPAKSLRLVDYESNVDVVRSLRDLDGAGEPERHDLAESYHARMAAAESAGEAFLKAHDAYLDSLDRRP